MDNGYALILLLIKSLSGNHCGNALRKPTFNIFILCLENDQYGSANKKLFR